jgi:hypothetical protein
MIKVTFEEIDTPFRQCTNLVSTSTSLAYCIKYHEWITKCPNKCGFFEEGSPGNLDDLKKEKFNPECFYFARSDADNSIYQCKLFKQENPMCESCQYLKLPNGKNGTS